jgi:hypothetical protein
MFTKLMGTSPNEYRKKVKANSWQENS